MEKSSTSHLGLLASGVVALLLAVYFLLPVVFLVPLNAAWERRYVSPELAAALCEPLSFLDYRLPTYHRMLEAEGSFCRDHGFDAEMFIDVGGLPLRLRVR